MSNVAVVSGSIDAATEFVSAAEELRDKLAETSADVDRQGTYPEENMRLIEASPLNALTLPVSAGGAAPDASPELLPTMMQVLTHLAAGESSTAQIWAFSQGQSVALTGSRSPLPEQVRRKLVNEIVDRGVRFCSPNAERYKKRFDFRVPIRRVTGGVVISGTKYFATGSAGAHYAQSMGLMEGYESVETGGAYNVLVDLSSDGVELHDDWDNMGQRATSSGAVTYHDVFVPDGYHWAPPAGGFNNPNDTTGVVTPFSLTAVLLGIGLGAMDALVDHLNTRGTFPGALEDTSIRYQIGLHAARLTSAQASLMDAAHRAVAFLMRNIGTRAEASIAVTRAKISVVEATLGFTADMHKFLGGQSSSNVFRYDRFWRNARTLSLQDVMDVRAQQLGAWTLKHEEPPVTWVS